MGQSSNSGGQRSRSPFGMLGLGFEIAVPVVLLALGGHWLDGRLDSEPWLLLLGAFLGMVVGFYNLMRRVAGRGQGGDGTSG